MVYYEQITRLLLIIHRVKSGRFFTTKSLVAIINNELGSRGSDSVSLRTIQRDLNVLSAKPFYMNITHNPIKGYRIEESDSSGIDIDQLLEPFDILNALNADAGLSDIIITEKYNSKGTQHLYLLINAIRKCLPVSFNYSKYFSDEPSIRILDPYNIKQFKGQWYLIGMVPESKEIRTFGLDRIHDLIALKNKYKKDLSVNIHEKFKYSYGIYSSEDYPIEDIILSFDRVDGSYLKSVPLHTSQEIVSETNNEVIIKLRLRITEDFIMAIISRSWSLKVIKPQVLKKRIGEIYKSALDRNSIP